jgi:predicted short-subunit dehydrogenase-like oxidoreductase (DUF2520 family)
MTKVVVLGAGNVAHHLITAFKKTSDITVAQVWARHTDSFTNLLSSEFICNDLSQLQNADVYILAVSDDAIISLSAQLPFSDKLVVHTSGSVALEALNDKNRKGVFYPLQTFSKSKTLDFNTIPICIEATNDSDYKTLERVAKAISKVTHTINSDQRKALHVSAVFVSNFVNHLYQIGEEICKKNQLDFAILQPLILESANKILTLSPKEAQTGPAKRQDTKTINAHLNFLTEKNQKEIYKLLTKSIIDNGKKL